MGYSQLSQIERYVIANMVRQRCSLRQIGLALDRSVATVSRELKRNRCEYDGWYRAEKAHERALAAAGAAARRANTALRSGPRYCRGCSASGARSRSPGDASCAGSDR